MRRERLPLGVLFLLGEIVRRKIKFPLSTDFNPGFFSAESDVFAIAGCIPSRQILRGVDQLAALGKQDFKRGVVDEEMIKDMPCV